jgi:WhiB family redox-sensing transcriptional regulator
VFHAANDWRHRAACRNHENPDLWFSDGLKSEATREAKRICHGCPVRRDCGDEAARHGIRDGVAGGYHTKFTGEWEQLHIWLGRELPNGRRGKQEPRAVVCAQCGNEFETRRQDLLMRCPPCVQGLVDAVPVREHIIRVKAATGWSNRQIGERAGVSKNAVRALLIEQQYISRTTAVRLRAVRPDLLTEAAA